MICGLNSKGQLGLGNQANILIPTPIAFSDKIIKIACSQFSAVLTKNGKAFFWGNTPFELILHPTEYLTNKPNNRIIDFCVSSNSAFLLDYNNNLFSWGLNEKGNLGLGDLLNRREFTQVKELKGKNINRFCESSWNKFSIFIGNTKNVNEETICKVN